METNRNNSNVMENVDRFGNNSNKSDESQRQFDKQKSGDKWSRSHEDQIQSVGQNADSKTSDRSKGTSERGPTKEKNTVFDSKKEINDTPQNKGEQRRKTDTIY